VINLGLDPWEALAMGLEVETIPARKGDGKVPVADYIRDSRWSGRGIPRPSAFDQDEYDWADWLQTHRVELNAMSSPQFLSWLDAKMEEHGQGKVIPKAEVLHATLKADARTKIRDLLIEDAIRKLGIDEQVDLLTGRVLEQDASATVRDRVETRLASLPESLWTVPVASLANEIAESLVREALS
jgi:hypothetical protein